MGKPIDISGERYGRLVALPFDHGIPTASWMFLCDCGSTKLIKKSSVKSGAVRSCGCLHIERCKSGLNPVKHGDARVGAVKRLHAIWRGMLKRCNPSNNPYATRDYALRGITVCSEWQEYIPFKEWALSNGYDDNLSIDRIDNSRGYSPDNCRWATKTEQARNRRTSRFIEIFGERRTVAEWCDIFDISRSVFYNRASRGWDLERALKTPAKVVQRSVISRSTSSKEQYHEP